MIPHVTPTADWVIVLPVVLGLSGAAVLLMLRGYVRLQAWVCAGFLLGILVCDGVLVMRVWSDGPFAMTMGNWLPPFGISFVADMLGALFALTATIVALTVTLYLQMDAPRDVQRDGLYPLILLLIAGVSGAFLTGDLFNLYVWFEVTLIASFGLFVIAGNPLQLDGAVKYALPNFVATTMFLLGLGLLYGVLGTLNMADIVQRAPGADPVSLVAVTSILVLAFGIKAAAFPVNGWLPASYHTPPAGIAALIAGLLTKVAAYSLMRTMLHLLPEAGEALRPVVYCVAIATMVFGPLGAIAETNLRRALGFVLIGGVGVILAGASVASIDAASGASLYIVHAVLTIAALYLVAGLIERATGAADTRAMGGLYTSKPALAVFFLVLLLAVSGVPPFLGFWPKLMILNGILDPARSESLGWTAAALAGAVLINALLTLIAAARLWIRIFWKPAAVEMALQTPTGASAYGYVAAAALTVLIGVAGLWPNALIAASQLAASDLLDPARYIAALGLAP